MPNYPRAGRRGAIFFAAVTFIVGVVVQVAPTEVYGAFLAGRFIAGVGAQPTATYSAGAVYAAYTLVGLYKS